MDIHDVSLGIAMDVESALHKIEARTHVIGVDTDYLIPVAEQQHIHHTLFHADKNCTYEELSSLYGHDAFLHQDRWFGPRLRLFLEEGNPYVDGNPFTDDDE
jgi:homoserine O-acetyltransferase